MKSSNGRGTTSVRLALAVTAAVASGVLWAGPANAVVLPCGATITTNTVLTADILNCPGNGVRINASNVTLDLNGHTISGTQPTQNGPVGVFVLAGRSNVTVRNGRVTGFAFGVGLGDASTGNTVTNMQLDGNGSGVSSVSTVMGVNAFTSGNLVTANRVANNPFQGIGLTGSNNTIVGNAISGGGMNGIRIGAGGDTPVSNGSRVESNQLSQGRIILNNTSNVVVRGNQVTGNSSFTGIFVTNSSNALVQSNQVANNADGIGVQTSTGTVVADNFAVANTDDGIDVGSPGTTVARNTANQNRDFGIAAVAGTIDGGGNKASGNGNPAQCTPNIVCT